MTKATSNPKAQGNSFLATKLQALQICIQKESFDLKSVNFVGALYLQCISR